MTPGSTTMAQLTALAASTLALAACMPRGRVATNDVYRDASVPRVVDTPQATSFAAFGSDAVRRAALAYPEAQRQAVSPLSLTASDGSGLVLTSLAANTVVEGPLAFTELRLRFHNPESRIREGRFRITLPPDAAISRFAMRIGDNWQEAEVVERARAQRIYEDYLHRGADPALLENAAGNEFRARVFPIEAHAEKEIIVSYSERLTVHPYRLRLRGLPEVGTLDVQVRSRTPAGLVDELRIHTVNQRPEDDAVVAARTGSDAVSAATGVAIRVTPTMAASPASLGHLAIVFDTSASRAPGYPQQVEQLSRLIAKLAERGPQPQQVTVAAFDHAVEVVYRGPAREFGAAKAALLVRRPLGASNLRGALAWLATQAEVDRALLITDGVATAGSGDAAGYAETLRGSHIKRLDVLLVGGIRDTATAEALTRTLLPSSGAVIDGASTDDDIVMLLGRQVVAALDVSVPGAKWWWPRTLDGVSAGESRLVFAEFAQAPEQVSVVLGGGERFTHTVDRIAEPLLRREVARAHIAMLQSERSQSTDKQRRADLGLDIVAISTRERVLSDLTALLVLETEQDYASYGIARTGLADVLVVGQDGVALEQRQPIVVATPPVEDMFGDDPLSAGGFGPNDATLRVGPSDREKLLESEACHNCFIRRAPAVEPDEGYGYEFSDDPQAPGVPNPGPMRLRDVEVSMDEGPPNLDQRAQRRLADRPADHEGEEQPGPPPSPIPIAAADHGDDDDDDDDDSPAFAQKLPSPYTGRLAPLMYDVEHGQSQRALLRALDWRNESPGDAMALLGLGEALEAEGQVALAERSYASIAELFPSRADMQRFSAARLDRLAQGRPDSMASWLAVDFYRKAVKQRPDHHTGHRMLAYALLRRGDFDGAMAAIETALRTTAVRSRADSIYRVLAEDLGLIGAAWLRGERAQTAAVQARLHAFAVEVPRTPSLRFVLSWETDANDVDLHIHDGVGGHAFYERRELASGGALYEDVTVGYGPECFTVTRPDAYPYRLRAHYYSRGPIGYGMGAVQIIHHDGEGDVRVEVRPFVIMRDDAYIDLGLVRQPEAGGR